MDFKVVAIARLSFKAALNEKLLHLALLFGLGLMALSVALGDLGPGAGAKIVLDFGLGTMQLVSTLVAIALASHDMPRELERRTLYVVLSKPIGRTALIVGKYLGLVAALGLLIAAMALVFYGMLAVVHLPLMPHYLVAIATGALETFVVAGIATLFSLMTSPTLAALYALALMVLGHQTELIRTYGQHAGGFAGTFGEVLYRMIPNLEALNLKNDVVYGVLPSPAELGLCVAYALCLMIALTGLSVLVFRRKEL
ncbi:MAG TPA: ABC transporter permease subunit [Pantanalinema sp.]